MAVLGRTFYVAGSVANIERCRDLIRNISNVLGHQCTYDWTGDEDVAVLDDDARRENAEKCARGAMRADYLVFVVPGGRGAHVEMGIAIGLGRPVFVLAEDDETYDEWIVRRPSLFYSANRVFVVRDSKGLVSHIKLQTTGRNARR